MRLGRAGGKIDEGVGGRLGGTAEDCHAAASIWHPVAGIGLTLGGGGLGMVWGATTFDECVATVHAAVAAGIDLLDLAPRYGDGKAEEVVGAAFAGRLPDGRARHQQMQSRRTAAGRDRSDPAPLDRGQPAAAAPVAPRSVLPALECRARRGPSLRAGPMPPRG